VQVTFLLLAAMALYLLLSHVIQLAAQAMVTLVAVAVAIYSLNLLNQYTALRIATDQAYLRAFGRAGSDQLVLQFADMQHNGYYLAAMFFGLWLLPLGELVITSGYLPKVLGVLLIIGGVGYLVDLFVRFLVPGFGAGISPLVVPWGGRRAVAGDVAAGQGRARPCTGHAPFGPGPRQPWLVITSLPNANSNQGGAMATNQPPGSRGSNPPCTRPGCRRSSRTGTARQTSWGWRRSTNRSSAMRTC
jgi:Domain of unknown function (DUF4386)